jgi:antitoxin component YwqK of YwqJK toxin-antitoxin module
MKPELEEEFYDNGNVRFQSWYLNGKGHNEEGPAWIRYYEDGNVWDQKWLLNGNPHNEEGPAWIRYYKNGTVKFQEWWLNGKQLLKRNFTSLDMIRKMDAFGLFSITEIARFKI